MTTASASRAAASEQGQQRPWWMTLISGIFLVVVGAIMLWGSTATKVDTYLTLIVALGIWWVITGIFDLVHMFQDHTMWGWKLFMGIISIIAGIYLVQYPVWAATVLPQVMVLIVGIWALMYGIIMLFMGFRGGGWPAIVLGAIEILFGIILIGDYGKLGSGLAFLWAAAICAFVGGIFMIFAAFRQRRA